ncbi:hypothetical protein WJX77_002381 [Trebouxia sp. C0004]
MFSDLHVSVRTLDTCISVLQKIKKEATSRKAGILFLGDFWHARGALPVEPLNAILQEFESWRQPTLMLVGNHDQVSVGGLDHALQPLAAACSAIHIVDVPTLYRDALWLPYRKDSAQLQEAIEGAGDIKAVFAHADVMGAMMNESFQAKEGLPPDLFPKHVPTYTGHYHKPHTVADTNIRYIGSPYQVSRSEAGQQKELLVLDSNWQELERIPLDIGPRHFALSSATPALPADLRPGDKIKWTLPEPEAAEEAQKLTQQLLDQGVEVEVVVPAPQAAPRIPASESLGALALFHSYAATVGMSQPALDAALDLLREYEGQGAQLKHEAAVVQLDEMELEGYGPFRESCTYDLTNRGFCVITGRNEDDQGAESNGAGKSALVMAPLWALTGKSDARNEGGSGRGLTSSEVLNDEATSAHVCLRGHVNGKPFAIERSIKSGKRKGGPKRSALKFEYGGEDLTCLEQRLTQAEIDRVLGSDLLVRAVFHGQADATALLEAGDERFKAELGWVVNLDMWDEAKQLAAQQLKGATSQLSSVTGQEHARQAGLESLEKQADEAQKKVKSWHMENQQQQTAFQSALKLVQEHLQASVQSCRSKLSQLQHWLSHPEASSQQDAFAHQLQEAEEQLTHLRREAKQCEAEVIQASQRPVRMSSTLSAGIAQADTSNSNKKSEATPPGNRSEVNGRNGSSAEDVCRTGGGAAGHGWATFHASDEDRSDLMHSAQSIRGGNVWQPTSAASTSTATVEAPAAATAAAAVAARPVRPPRHVITPEVEAAEAQLHQLQNMLMNQQAELGAKRADVQAASSSYEQYLSLASQHLGHSTHQDSSELLCDRCLQPIAESTFQANVWRLEEVMEQARALQVKAEHDIRQCTTAVGQAAESLRRIQQEAAEAAENVWRCQVAQHEAAVRREQEAVQAEQAAQQAALQQQLKAWQAQEAARAAAEAIEQEKQQAQAAEQAAAWRQAEAIKEGARRKERAAWGAVSHAEAQYSALQMKAAQWQQTRAAQQQLAVSTLKQTEPALARLALQSSGMHEPTLEADQITPSDEDISQVCQQCSSLLRVAESASHDCMLQQQQLKALRQAVNPYSAEFSRLGQLQAESQEALDLLNAQKADLQQQVCLWGEVDRGFGRTGVQSFALEGVLGELQELTSRYLEQLSSGTTLTLAAFRPGSKSGAAEIERITKRVHVRSEGGLKERSIRQLSGGERRRVALALALGFADLIAGRGQLRCNFIVLDEVLQQLDGEGKSRVGAVLRNLPHTTILVVGQADSYLAQITDNVDVVIKRNGCASIE